LWRCWAKRRGQSTTMRILSCFMPRAAAWRGWRLDVARRGRVRRRIGTCRKTSAAPGHAGAEYLRSGAAQGLSRAGARTGGERDRAMRLDGGEPAIIGQLSKATASGWAWPTRWCMNGLSSWTSDPRAGPSQIRRCGSYQGPGPAPHGAAFRTFCRGGATCTGSDHARGEIWRDTRRIAEA